MEPIFTMQYSEYAVAIELQKLFPKIHGYSVLVPVSRQEKGIDLAILKKGPNGNSRTVTIQIKASKTYSLPPKRTTTKRHKHLTWFNAFQISEYADFYLLFATYPPDVQRTKPTNQEWWKHIMLLFTASEIASFLKSCLTTKGVPDRSFGFGFDDETRIEQTRGEKERRLTDFSDHLLVKRIDVLKKALNS